MAFVSGEIGIGKSTVIQAVSREAADQGVRVAVGYCYDLETSAPYSAWIDLFRQHRANVQENALPESLTRLLDGDVPAPPTIAADVENLPSGNGR